MQKQTENKKRDTIKEKLETFMRKRPYLIWYVKDREKLNKESIVEHTLNYGNWDDVQKLIKIMGIKDVAKIFRKETSCQRINYRSEVVNYFNLYFKKYAPYAQ